MKYSEWCKEYATKTGWIDSETAWEYKNQKIRDITEKLNNRLTKIFKCYGHRKFTKIENGEISYSQAQKINEIREEEIKELSEQYEKLNVEVELLDKNDLNERKKIKEKQKKKTDISKRIKNIASIEGSIQTMVDTTGQKRFATITEDEQKIFEMLLNQKEFDLLEKESISVDAMKCRVEFIELLSKVQHCKSWELNSNELYILANSMLVPGVEELKSIYEFLYDEIYKDEHKNNCTDDKNMNAIDCSYFREINSIYRKICRLQERILNDHASKIDWKGITGFNLKELKEGEENIIV